MSAVEYVALLSLSGAEARSAVDELLASESIPVVRSRKGKVKTVDIRPFIVSAEIQEELAVDFHMDVPPDRIPMAVTLALPPSGGARIAEVLERAFGTRAGDAWVLRKGFVFE